MDLRTVAPAPSDCSRARNDPLISRGVVMLVMFLEFVGLMRVFICLVVCLNIAFDASLLLYAISSAAKIMKKEKSDFINRKESFILRGFCVGSGENLHKFIRLRRRYLQV